MTSPRHVVFWSSDDAIVQSFLRKIERDYDVCLFSKKKAQIWTSKWRLEDVVFFSGKSLDVIWRLIFLKNDWTLTSLDDVFSRLRADVFRPSGRRPVFHWVITRWKFLKPKILAKNFWNRHVFGSRIFSKLILCRQKLCCKIVLGFEFSCGKSRSGKTYRKKFLRWKICPKILERKILTKDFCRQKIGECERQNIPTRTPWDRKCLLKNFETCYGKNFQNWKTWCKKFQ